jgi:hypothetical protein
LNQHMPVKMKDMVSFTIDEYAKEVAAMPKVTV